MLAVSRRFSWGDILVIIGLIMSLPLATVYGDGKTVDWGYTLISEAFPGSLLNLDADSSVTGGATNEGNVQRVGFAVNNRKQMAITWESGDANVSAVVARSDDGKKWLKQDLRADATGVVGTIGNMSISASYAGVGSRVRLADDGTALITVPRAGHIETFLWPATERKMSSTDRLPMQSAVQRCGQLVPVTGINWYDLALCGDKFVLLTVGQGRVQAYEFVNKKWVELGGPIAGDHVSVGWDSEKKDIYLTMLCKNRSRLKYPSVWRWSASERNWQELAVEASGLSAANGVPGYAGASDKFTPVVVAHDRRVWCFWLQDAPTDWRPSSQYLLQGAEWDGTKWKSCGKSNIELGDRKWGERESMGPDVGIERAEFAGAALGFYDDNSRSTILLCSGGNMGYVLQDGAVKRIALGRVNSKWKMDEGVFDNTIYISSCFKIVSADAFTPHVESMQFCNGEVYIANIYQSRDLHSDAFVRRYQPVPVGRVFGIRLEDPDEKSRTWAPVIAEVVKGSKAEQSGLQVGDRLVAIGENNFEVEAATNSRGSQVCRATKLINFVKLQEKFKIKTTRDNKPQPTIDISWDR